MLVEAVDGVYDIPEEYEEIFYAYDKAFRQLGLSDAGINLINGWDATFVPYLITEYEVNNEV